VAVKNFGLSVSLFLALFFLFVGKTWFWWIADFFSH